MIKLGQVTQSSSTLEVEAVIDDYFDTFNRNDFVQTALLFTEAGKLFVPFDAPVVGQAAIAAYLKQEATSMSAFPSTGQAQPLPAAQTQVTMQGQVQTTAFKVTVEWRFVVTPQARLAEVHVRLLASMSDLLELRAQA